MKLERFSPEEFERLVSGARLVVKDTRGPKVYEAADGRMVKLFRVKRLISSNLLSPFAVRFRRNAERLNELGVPSVTVLQVANAPHLARQVVVYEKLPGQPLRDVLRAGGQDGADMVAQAGRFIAEVHGLGVYFRSFHFGNILVFGGDRFALIDVLDTRFHKRPLGARQRLRNFRHMIRYAEDRQALAEH